MTPDDRERETLFPCGHQFLVKCLQPWLCRKRKEKCPLCREIVDEETRTRLCPTKAVKIRDFNSGVPVEFVPGMPIVSAIPL